jgi:hypothetical protein
MAPIQEVGMKRLSAMALLALVSAAGPKGSLRVEFPMKRVDCPSGRED